MTEKVRDQMRVCVSERVGERMSELVKFASETKMYYNYKPTKSFLDSQQ